MQDLHQIEVIKKALEKERERYIFDLAKQNEMIAKKVHLTQKMSSYLSEYTNDKNFKMSKSIPSLYINLNSFSHQIEDVIEKTEIEITHLKKSTMILFGKIEKIDQKIKLMDVFSDRIVQAKILKNEKREQLALDDLAAIKQIRGSYD